MHIKKSAYGNGPTDEQYHQCDIGCFTVSIYSPVSTKQRGLVQFGTRCVSIVKRYEQ